MAMSMLLQQIRRATCSRRGTAAALTPPHTFSRFYSTNYRARLLEEEETLTNFWGFLLNNGLAISIMYGTFNWVDYGGCRRRDAEWKKLHADYEEERELYYEVKKQLDDLREEMEGNKGN